MSTTHSRMAARDDRQTWHHQYANAIAQYITSLLIAIVFGYFFISWLSERSTFRLLGDEGIQMAMVHNVGDISFYIQFGIVLSVVVYSLLEDCGMWGAMALGMLVSTIGIWDVLTTFLVEEYWPYQTAVMAGECRQEGSWCLW
ncbi:hypothetical protein V8F20_006437 [Naviculisporaceae sp. PSN 640]